MKKSFLLLFTISLSATFHLSSQEEQVYDNDDLEQVDQVEQAEQETFPPPYPLDQHPPGDDRLYVIVAFEFDIRGRTRPNALLHNAELRVGEELHGRAGLEEFIRDRTQVFTNMRILRDTAEISYSVGARREDGSYPVTLLIKVEDSWNIIALPIPEYDSNTGFELDLRIRHYNFLGTMTPLRIDFGYHRGQDGRNSFRAMIDSSIPFTARGYRWNFLFVNTFEYRPESYEPFFFQNTTGLSVELPFRRTTFTVGFEESFLLNQENPRAHRVPDVDVPWYTIPYNFQRGPYMSSRMFVSWRVPTGLTTRNFGELTYTVTPSVTFNHELPGHPLQDFRRGPFANISHSLGFGRVNWHGNHRSGLSASLSNSFHYDFFRYVRLQDPQDPFHARLTFEGATHIIVNRFIGMSARLQSRRWFFFDGQGFYDNAGDVLRGIADRSLQATYMLSVNMNLPIRMLAFTPSHWLNSNRLRAFNFEFHISPMLDIAMFDCPRTGRDVAAAGGLEFIVFPDVMRALFLRLSIGIDVLEFLSTRSIPGGNAREISLGLGHFF